MSRFTPGQWREIDDARARLEAYRLKIQPYPERPVEQASTSSDVLVETSEENLRLKSYVPFRPRPVDKEIDQLKAGFLFLQAKVNELQAKKKIDDYEPF